MDYLTDHYRISKTWLGAQMGLSPRGFDYATKRGFRESEVKNLEKALHGAAMSLRKRLPPPDRFSKFCKERGLNKTWIAHQLGFVDVASLIYAAEKRGLNEDEKDTLRLIFKNVAETFENFKIPRTLRQNAIGSGK